MARAARMSSFALIARNYMNTFGATREDFGKIAVAQRANALRNPNALMKAPLTLDQYMAARPIADPIHLFDCVMPCAGAEAFLVMREETAASLKLPAVRGARDHRAAQCVRRAIPSRCAAAGRWTSTSSTRWPASGPTMSTSCRPTTTIR